MARYYQKIDKQAFLDKVQAIMEHDEFPYELPNKIAEDLNKVEFAWENYTSFDETKGFATYPVGFHDMGNDMFVFFVNAGGDWEFPICFVFYWSGKEMRAYIPVLGNSYHKKQKVAYGSHEMTKEEEERDDETDMQDEYAKVVDESLLMQDIRARIKLKDPA